MGRPGDKNGQGVPINKYSILLAVSDLSERREVVEEMLKLCQTN